MYVQLIQMIVDHVFVDRVKKCERKGRLLSHSTGTTRKRNPFPGMPLGWLGIVHVDAMLSPISVGAGLLKSVP